MTDTNTLTAAAAAVIGGFVGGALQGWGTLLAPGRQARLDHKAWLLREQRIVFASVAAMAIDTLAFIEDQEWRNKADETTLTYFNESRGIHMPSPGDLLKVTAELKLVGTPAMRTLWDKFLAAEKEISVSYLYATEDEGLAVEHAIPALKDASNGLLKLLEDAFSVFPGSKSDH